MLSNPIIVKLESRKGIYFNNNENVKIVKL